MKAKIELTVKGSYDHALKEGHRLLPNSARNAKISAKRRKDSDVYDVKVNYEDTVKKGTAFDLDAFFADINNLGKGK